MGLHATVLKVNLSTSRVSREAFGALQTDIQHWYICFKSAKYVGQSIQTIYFCIQDIPKTSMRTSIVVRDNKFCALSTTKKPHIRFFKITFMYLKLITRPPSKICNYVRPFVFLRTSLNHLRAWKVSLFMNKERKKIVRSCSLRIKIHLEQRLGYKLKMNSPVKCALFHFSCINIRRRHTNDLDEGG